MRDKHISLFLEIVAGLFLLLSLYPIMRYGTLADVQVPQHFSKDGFVDIWTTRKIFIYLGLIFIALYSFLSVCQSHPNWINIPFDGKMSEQDRTSLAKSVAVAIKLWCMAICAYLSISSYRIALGKEQCMNDTVKCIIYLCAIVHLSLILILQLSWHSDDTVQ